VCPERVALCTAAYPGVEPFLAAWYRSVEEQTDRGFDLWIALDGLSPEAVSGAIGGTPEARWLPMAAGGSPAQVRSVMLGELTARYDALVLVDSDDVLLPSRVSAARAAIGNADLAACACEIVDRDGRELGAVLEWPAGMEVDDLLPRYNLFGLSNTAYRAELLRECLPVPDECVLIDWLLATRAWALDARLGFDPTPRMRYRQYAANAAPMLPPFGPPEILRATERVLGHYRLMLDGDRALPAARRARLAAERARVQRFDAAIRGQPATLAAYVDHLNRLPPMRVWWWQVAHPMLESLWSS
jgi:hypothetical protein